MGLQHTLLPQAVGITIPVLQWYTMDREVLQFHCERKFSQKVAEGGTTQDHMLQSICSGEDRLVKFQ